MDRNSSRPPRGSLPPASGPERSRAAKLAAGSPSQTRPVVDCPLPELPGQEQKRQFQRKWGAQIDDDLLVQALTHRSFAHENPGLQHNERLEFLGDAVLELIVTERLFRTYSAEGEGALTKMRQAVVSRPALASVARELGLGEYLLLGKGERRDGGGKDSLLSNAVEALIGATYLCHGFAATRVVVERHLEKLLSSAYVRGAVVDYKTILNQLCQGLGLGEAEYAHTSTGPDHARKFQARVLIAGQVAAQGRGTSKKQAEHAAARQAVEDLRAAHGIKDPLGYEDPATSARAAKLQEREAAAKTDATGATEVRAEPGAREATGEISSVRQPDGGKER